MIFKKSPQISSNVSILKFYSLGGCVSRKPLLNGFFGYNSQRFSPLWEEGGVRDRGEKALNSLSDSLKSCFFQTEKVFFSPPVSCEVSGSVSPRQRHGALRLFAVRPRWFGPVSS